MFRFTIRELVMLTLVIVVPPLACLANEPEPHTHQVIDGEKIREPWREVVGKQVTVDGLAWGAHEKGLGPRVILDRSAVYVENVDYLKAKVNGKLVRITGTLRFRQIDPAPQAAQSFGPKSVTYYAIEVESMFLIDQVETPWMQEVNP
jgi:hypothetical protein